MHACGRETASPAGLIFLGVLALAVVLPAAAHAQFQQADRVRILTQDGLTHIGVVADITPDSVMLKRSDELRWVRRSDVAYLERSTRRYRRFFRNLAVTAGSTAGIGALIGGIAYKKCVSNEFLGCLMSPENRVQAFILGGVMGATVGIPVGVIVGSSIRYDQWEPALQAHERRSSLSIIPLPKRGIGLSASFSF